MAAEIKNMNLKKHLAHKLYSEVSVHSDRSRLNDILF